MSDTSASLLDDTGRNKRNLSETKSPEKETYASKVTPPPKRNRNLETPITIDNCSNLESHLTTLTNCLTEIAPNMPQKLKDAITGIVNCINATTSKCHELELQLDSILNKAEAKANYEKSKFSEQLRLDRTQSLEQSERTTKLLGIPFSSAPKDKKDMIDVVKDYVGRNGNEHTSAFNDAFKFAKIRTVGREPKVFDGVPTLPVLMEFQTVEQKRSFDRETRSKIKDPGFRLAYEWPSDLHKKIKKWRSHLSNYKSEKVDLTDKQLLFRPSRSCKNIEIMYRAPSQKKWSLFETFTAPLNESRAADLDIEMDPLPRYLI